VGSGREPLSVSEAAGRPVDGPAAGRATAKFSVSGAGSVKRERIFVENSPAKIFDEDFATPVGFGRNSATFLQASRPIT